MDTEAKRILVPLDGSREAERVIPCLLPLSRALHGELILLHVDTPGEEEGGKRAYLESRCDYLRSKGIRADFLEAFSESPSRGIVSTTHSLGRFWLVAMTTRRHGGIWDTMVPDTTEQVLRRSDVPVLVWPTGARERRYSQILVAMGGGRDKKELLQEASDVARAFHSTIHVAWVGDPAFPGLALGEGVAVGVDEEVGDYLRDVCTGFSVFGTSAEPVMLYGNTAEELIRHAKETHAGLIFLTTQGRSGLSRLFKESVASRVLKNAPCPVIIKRRAPVPSLRVA